MTVWNGFRSRFIVTRASGLSTNMPEVCVSAWAGLVKGRSHDLRGSNNTGVHEAQHNRGGADQNVT